jgi:hypothetical protein
MPQPSQGEELQQAIVDLDGLPHAIFALVLDKAGGDVVVDHEDCVRLLGHAVRATIERGSIRLRLVRVKP